MLPGVTKTLIDDPNVGMLFISFPINTPAPIRAFNEGMAHSPKPKVMVALGDTWKLGPDVEAAIKESTAVFSRSSDRMLRAIALYTRYGRLLARNARFRHCGAVRRTASARQGHAAGMARQEGPRRGGHSRARRRSRTHRGRGSGGGEADRLSGGSQSAGRGVVAQDRSRRRGAEPGGESALRAAWDAMMLNVKRAAPDVSLDGALVDKMSPRGIELMVGANAIPRGGRCCCWALAGSGSRHWAMFRCCPVTPTNHRSLRLWQAALEKAPRRRARRAAGRCRRRGAGCACHRPLDAAVPE